MPMTEQVLLKRDAKRDLGAELLESVRQMKAGKRGDAHAGVGGLSLQRGYSMMTILPDVLDALIAFLMERDGIETRIIEGFQNSTKAMQAQFPLDARIRQERDRYQRDVVVAAMNGLMICNAIGAPVADPWNGLLPGPLFVQDKDLFEWLKGWAPTDAMNVMRAVISGWSPALGTVKQKPGPKPDDAKQEKYLDGAARIESVRKALRTKLQRDPNKDEIAAQLMQEFSGTKASIWKRDYIRKHN